MTQPKGRNPAPGYVAPDTPENEKLRRTHLEALEKRKPDPTTNGASVQQDLVIRRDSPIVVASDHLTDDEKSELAKHEAVIERYRDAYDDVGNSLRAIRDKRLYRETHKTFEAYCDEHLGFTKTHANRLIKGAAVVQNLTPIGVKPKNLAQCVPLARLEPEQQREAWSVAQENAAGKEVTAFRLEQAALQIAPRKPVKIETEEEKKERLARQKKNQRDRERKQQKEQEEADRRKQQRLEEWSKGFHVVVNRFERSWESRPIYRDLASAIEVASDIPDQDVAIFHGGKWMASVYVDGDNVEIVRRDDAEGGEA